jgi:hypothetical protein
VNPCAKNLLVGQAAAATELEPIPVAAGLDSATSAGMPFRPKQIAQVGFAYLSAALPGCSSDGNGGGPGAGGEHASGGSLTMAGSSGMVGVAGSGQAGASASGGAGGAAGNSPGAAGSAGGAGLAGTGQGGAAGGGNTVMACPADATFCSGFEEATLPSGAVYKVNAAPGEWSRDFAIDTAVFKNGSSALRVKGMEDGISGSAYQMLAVPAAMGAFWARFYIRQDELDIGGVGHNVFAGAADSDEPNSGVMVELAEDVGFAFNNKDDVRWPMGYGRLMGVEMPFTLVKGVWHCVEISYDSENRQQRAYVDGELMIDASNYPATVQAPFNTFKFGFNKLHGPTRAVWYDDVAVGPTRAGCP